MRHANLPFPISQPDIGDAHAGIPGRQWHIPGDEVRMSVAEPHIHGVEVPFPIAQPHIRMVRRPCRTAQSPMRDDLAALRAVQ